MFLADFPTVTKKQAMVVIMKLQQIICDYAKTSVRGIPIERIKLVVCRHFAQERNCHAPSDYYVLAKRMTKLSLNDIAVSCALRIMQQSFTAAKK